MSNRFVILIQVIYQENYYVKGKHFSNEQILLSLELQGYIFS